MSRASQPKNPWVGRNFIPDNPKMEVPPAWFLQQIYDFDAELVLFPSRHRPFAYVVARRLLNRRWSQAQIDTCTQPDTRLCMDWNLIPVCLMFKHGPTWSADAILQKLRARDMWAHGGADKVADMIEADEAEEQRKRDQAVRDDMWNRSGEAYRLYKRRTGQRVTNPGPARSGAAQSNSSSSSTATGIVLAN